MQSPVVKLTDSLAQYLHPWHPATWQPATWQDYLALRDHAPQSLRLFFNQGWLWLDMGSEGINHANISDLIITLVLLWGITHPEYQLNSFSRCQLEKDKEKACAPDLVVYGGGIYPRWQPGESRFINLDRMPIPDLVGEVSDTTLADDLASKKQLYASLGIGEYWVIEVPQRRVHMFALQGNGKYEEVGVSKTLLGVSAQLLQKTLIYLEQGTNAEAAAWFSQQIAP
jgi:Uma2 family endonuclease